MRTLRNSVFALSLFLAIGAAAQEGLWTFNYSMGLPVGEAQDFVENTSFRGFTVDGRKFIPGKSLSVGGQMGWQTFYEKREDQLESRPGADAFGTQYRYVNNFGISFDTRYHLKPERELVPYVGVGIGTTYIRRRLDFGLWSFDEDSWRFTIRPDVGILYNFPGTNMGAHLSGSYYMNFKTKDNPEFNYVGIQVGLVSYF